MTVWEIVILILVGSLVSMVEICVILAAVSKMIDAKTDAKIKMTTALFRNEMDYLDKLFDKYMKQFGELIESILNKKPQQKFQEYSMESKNDDFENI